MRNIGTIPDASQAAVLADALFARGVEVDLRDADAGVAVWVHDDAHVDAARAALRAFLDDGPDGFRGEAETGRAARREAQAKDRAYRERVALARRTLHGADGQGYVTSAVLALSVGVTLLAGFGTNTALVDLLQLTLAPVSAGLPEVRSGEVWRLISPILLHFSVLHLVFDVVMGWRFARVIEVRKGGWLFGLLVVSAAIVSNLGELAWAWGAGRTFVRFGGLSGVVYALAGYVAAKRRLDPTDTLDVDRSTVVLLVGWLVVCLFLPGIANGAHVFGFLHGLVFAALDVAWFTWRKRRLR